MIEKPEEGERVVYFRGGLLDEIIDFVNEHEERLVVLENNKINGDLLMLSDEQKQGRWECICGNPTPSESSVSGKRKCLFCGREMVRVWRSE